MIKKTSEQVIAELLKKQEKTTEEKDLVSAFVTEKIKQDEQKKQRIYK